MSFEKGNNNNAYILFADIAGYTSLMQKDQNEASRLLLKFRTVLQQSVSSYNGKVVNFYGDGALCIFDDVNKMLEAALEIQLLFQQEPIVPVRIGLHAGEVFYEDKNAYGNAINVASRIESIGISGAITMSALIKNELNNPAIQTKHLGTFDFKNVQDKMAIYAVSNAGFVVPKKHEIKGKLKNKKSNPLPFIAGTMALMASLFFIYLNKTSSNQQSLKWDRSLAVIPLENLNQQEDQHYFSDGISQDILTNLSGLKDLQIISFNSSKKYRNSNKSIKEIGKELGVKHLLMGSVQQQGAQLRVRAMLVNAENDQQLWAKKYDENIENIFDIQSEVARNIADVLKAKLSTSVVKRINQKPTHNLDAYQYYSQGRYAWEQRTPESLQDALVYFEKAIALDSAFALAYSGIAQTYITIGANNYDLPSIVFPKGKAYAEKTLSINPDLADAYTTLAAYYYDHEFDFDKSLNYFQRALELKPNDATTHQWLAEAYYSKGDIINARNEIKIAKSLNPNSVSVKIVDASICIGESQPEKAIEQIKFLIKENPKLRTLTDMLIFTYYESGQHQKAWEYLKQSDPEQKILYRWIELYSKDGAFDKMLALKPKIEAEKSVKYRKWLTDLIDFKLLLQKGDSKGYIAKIDSFIFIEKNRNLFNQQNFHPPDSIIAHPDYKKMMTRRGFELIDRNF